uniref:Transmembrane protein 218 n=1 Tax=Aquila chrysaetos chrysaetos TaxID=223781 RepID=A0A663F5B0_AQUCH
AVAKGGSGSGGAAWRARRWERGRACWCCSCCGAWRCCSAWRSPGRPAGPGEQRERGGLGEWDRAGPGAEAAPPASPRRFAVVLVTLGAAVLSAALLLFPREDERPATAAADEIVDTFFIGRFILLAVMSLVLLGCLFLLLIYHLMEPVYAKPLHSS